MVESYESYSDERGPAKAYETILRLSSGFDLSPIAFIKILEGKLNEQSEGSELNDEILSRLKNLSTHSVGQLLYLLEQKQNHELIELMVCLLAKPNSFLEKFKILLQAPPETLKSLFQIFEILKDHNQQKGS